MRKLSRLLAAALLPFALASCVETTGTTQYFVPGSAPAAKAGGRADQVRAALENSCRGDSGTIFSDGAIAKQCGCYATTMVKSMSKEDLEFYATYNVVPTLTAARPEDVKKQCGIAFIPGAGPKAKLPVPEGY
jgi:hypothetical protein